MSENKSHLNMIGGALSLTISAIIVKIIGLIYKVPLSYILLDEGMGYFNSAYTVYTFFYIISTAGIPKSISILTSKAESEGDSLRVEAIYKTAFKMFFIFALIIAASLFILSEPISILIGNRGAYLTLITIAPSIMFVAAAGVLRGYFNGKLILVPIAISELISGISKLLLGLAFAMLGYRLNLKFELISALSILGLTFGSFFGFIYLLIYMKIKLPSNKTRQKSVFNRLEIRKTILKIAIPLTVTSAIASLGGIIDLATIMNRLKHGGYSEFQAGIIYGNYTTEVIPMFNLIGTVIAPISSVILPIVSSEKFLFKRELYIKRLGNFFKILSIVCIPVFFVFMLIPGELLSVIFEDGSAIMAAPLLKLLAPSVILMSYLTILNTILEGVGKTKIPLISLIIGIIVKFVSGYILMGMDDFGIFGAPISTGISYFVSIIISYGYLTYKMKLKLKLMPSFLLSFMTAMLVFVPSLKFLSRYTLNHIIFILALALIFLIYLGIILVIFMFFDKINKKKMAKYTKNQISNYKYGRN